MNKLKLSKLSKTWIFDLDGTLLEHNGHLTNEDKFLPGVLSFLQSISEDDKIVILTARSSEYSAETLKKFDEAGINVDHWVFDLGSGERILFNDDKPSGLRMAFCYSVKRNQGLEDFEIAESGDL